MAQAELDSWAKWDQLPPILETELQAFIYELKKEDWDKMTMKDVRDELEQRMRLAPDCLRFFDMRLRDSAQKFIQDKRDEGMWSDDNNSEMPSARHGDEGEQLASGRAMLHLQRLNDEIAQINHQITKLTNKNINLQTRRNDILRNFPVFMQGSSSSSLVHSKAAPGTKPQTIALKNRIEKVTVNA